MSDTDEPLPSLAAHNREVLSRRYPERAGVRCDRQLDPGTCGEELRYDTSPLLGIEGFARAISAKAAGTNEVQKVPVICVSCGFKGFKYE